MDPEEVQNLLRKNPSLGLEEEPTSLEQEDDWRLREGATPVPEECNVTIKWHPQDPP